MLDEIEKLYALMRRYIPELADQADTLLTTEKEKFIKSVEPAVKRFVERRTKNVSGIKSSFNDKVNEPAPKTVTVNKAVWRTNGDDILGKPKGGEGLGAPFWCLVFIGGVFTIRWIGKKLKATA